MADASSDHPETQPATVPTAPQPMDPEKRKKLILLLVAGGAVLVLVIVSNLASRKRQQAARSFCRWCPSAVSPKKARAWALRTRTWSWSASPRS